MHLQSIWKTHVTPFGLTLQTTSNSNIPAPPTQLDFWYCRGTYTCTGGHSTSLTCKLKANTQAEEDLEADRSSGSHWSAMNTKEPGRRGMGITKVGCEKKVNAFSRSEPPMHGLPKLCHSPRGSLQCRSLVMLLSCIRLGTTILTRSTTSLINQYLGICMADCIESCATRQGNSWMHSVSHNATLEVRLMRAVVYIDQRRTEFEMRYSTCSA